MGWFDPTTILALIAVAGVAWGIYNYFHTPDIEANKREAILDLRITNIEKNLSNDLPHIDAQIKDIHHDISDLREKFVQLSTIIQERMPKHQ